MSDARPKPTPPDPRQPAGDQAPSATEGSVSRRDFLKGAAGGVAVLTTTAAGQRRALGANDRISIGVIGCGGRGFGAHMPGVHAHAETQNVEITAVCDVWSVYRERAAEKVEEWYGRTPRQFSAYRELLALDDVDVVMIASPDFQHCAQLEDTADAGKDAYCEKPLAMNMEELRSACDAVEDAGTVVQIGTQLRSMPTLAGCKAVCEAGILGTISRIEQCRNGTQPYWYSRIARLPINESEVDWDEFLLGRRRRPFDAQLFAGWYGYREFSSGPIGGFMSHFIDLIHYFTGARFPSSAVAQGGTFVWDDEYEFDCPDHVQTTLVYPEGFMVSYCTNFGNGSGNRSVVYGTKGALDFTNWSAPVVSAAGACEETTLGEETPVEPVELPDHYLDWLQCLRSREAPIASIEAGYQHAVAVILADMAYESGRRHVYDHKDREIRRG